METECKNIDEVRKNIDEIDDLIVKLLSQRSYFVRQAAKFKKSKEDVKSPERIEEIIRRVRRLAEEYGAPPDIVENIYRAMIDNFINYEMNEYSKE